MVTAVAKKEIGGPHLSMGFGGVFSSIPILLMASLVFYHPSNLEKANVDQVRQDVARATAYVQSLVSGNATQVADSKEVQSSSSLSASPYRANPIEPKRASTGSTREWESRPQARDYSNGRSTQMTYGIAQREIANRRGR